MNQETLGRATRAGAASSGGTARPRAEKNALAGKIEVAPGQGEAAVNSSRLLGFNVQK